MSRRHGSKSMNDRGSSPQTGVQGVLASESLVFGLLLAALAAVVLLAHWPVLSAQALSFDDRDYLVRNPLVRNPGPESVGRFFGELTRPTQRGMYQPLTMTSLMLDWAMGGRPENLRAFHRTNLALHVLNTLMLAVLLRRLSGSAWAAAGAALLFGVHPLNVEPMAWVAERGTLLAGGLAFLAMWLHLVWARDRSRAAWAGCIVVYALALMAKPTALALPAVLLVLDYWPLDRLNARAAIEKIPHIALGAFFAGVVYVSRTTTMPVNWPGLSDPLRVPLIVCHSILFYLRRMVLPFDLAGHYPKPAAIHFSDGPFLAGVVGTAALVALAAVLLRRTRAVLAGLAIYTLLLLPTMQIIGFSLTLVSEKYACLAFVGPLTVLAGGLAAIARLPPAPRTNLARRASIVAVVLAAIACGWITRTNLARWRDTPTLYASMLERVPEAITPRFNLGVHYQELGELQKAIPHFRKALELQPANAEVLSALGGALVNLDRPEEAAAHLRKAVRLDPGLADARYNLGTALVELGLYDQAEPHLAEAIKLAPGRADAYGNLGNAFNGLGRLPEAEAAFTRALDLDPGLVPVRFNLARLLARRGDLAGTARQLEAIVRLQPDSVEGLCRLAWLRAASYEDAVRNPPEAVRLAERAASVTGQSDPGVLDVLAVAYAAAGRFDEAVATAQKALRLIDGHSPSGLDETIRNRLELFRAGVAYREQAERP